jgi:hypothetical protein
MAWCHRHSASRLIISWDPMDLNWNSPNDSWGGTTRGISQARILERVLFGLYVWRWDRSMARNPCCKLTELETEEMIHKSGRVNRNRNQTSRQRDQGQTSDMRVATESVIWRRLLFAPAVAFWSIEIRVTFSRLGHGRIRKAGKRRSPWQKWWDKSVGWIS